MKEEERTEETRGEERRREEKRGEERSREEKRGAERKEPQLTLRSLFGPTCDSLDVICDVELPDLQVGDWLYFTNMGAYTVASATHFNGFLPPNAHYIIDITQSQ
jgi:diaminopimelate decarboxylase